MAYDPTTTLSVLTSWLRAQGRYDGVQIGEPKSPPAGKLTAAVIMDSIRTPETVLDAPVRVYNLRVRHYMNMLDDGSRTETELARVVGDTMADLEGDYTLGGNIRAIDHGGIYGPGMQADWGYLEVSGQMYRFCDLTLALIVDAAAATFVA